MQVPQFKFNPMILNGRSTGCSMLSTCNIFSRYLSLLDANSPLRKTLHESLNCYDDEDDADNENIWLSNCRYEFLQLFADSLDYAPGTTTSMNNAWETLNSLSDDKPQSLQHFNDAKRTQHQTLECIDALYFLLDIEHAHASYYVTCINDCQSNKESNNNIESESNDLFIWNPSNTGVSVRLQSVLDEAIAFASRSGFEHSEQKCPSTCQECSEPLGFFRQNYHGQSPDIIWIVLGFYCNVDDESKSTRNIYQLTAFLNGIEYGTLVKVSS